MSCACFRNVSAFNQISFFFTFTDCIYIKAGPSDILKRLSINFPPCLINGHWNQKLSSLLVWFKSVSFNIALYNLNFKVYTDYVTRKSHRIQSIATLDAYITNKDS